MLMTFRYYDGNRSQHAQTITHKLGSNRFYCLVSDQIARASDSNTEQSCSRLGLLILYFSHSNST